jgi:hypothetical protein
VPKTTKKKPKVLVIREFQVDCDSLSSFASHEPICLCCCAPFFIVAVAALLFAPLEAALAASKAGKGFHVEHCCSDHVPVDGRHSNLVRHLCLRGYSLASKEVSGQRRLSRVFPYRPTLSFNNMDRLVTTASPPCVCASAASYAKEPNHGHPCVTYLLCPRISPQKESCAGPFVL